MHHNKHKHACTSVAILVLYIARWKGTKAMKCYILKFNCLHRAFLL